MYPELFDYDHWYSNDRKTGRVGTGSILNFISARAMSGKMEREVHIMFKPHEAKGKHVYTEIRRYT